jgi:hypothetical protein
MTNEDHLTDLDLRIKNLKGVLEQMTVDQHNLRMSINEKKLTEKKYSEKDLYDFAMNILYPKYNLNKRGDIIQDWAKEEVENFKKIVS